jgi:hypothetical protein
MTWNVKLEPGDMVLLGGHRGSQPSGWFIGTLLVVEGDQIGVRHQSLGSGNLYDFYSRDMVRATGTVEELLQIRDYAMHLIGPGWKRVRELENELEKARKEAWAAIDRLSNGRPLSARDLPSDFADGEFSPETETEC